MVSVMIWGEDGGVIVVGGALAIAAMTASAIWDTAVAIPLSFLVFFFFVTLDVGWKLSVDGALSCFSIRSADILYDWGVG